MSYNQLKAFRQYCNYLEIRTAEDLEIVKKYSGCTNMRDFINYLHHEVLIAL